MVKIKGIYRHFKGNLYLVEDIAIDSESMVELVIYRPLYGKTEKLWARPLEMFEEEVNRNGQKYRFELQEIESVAPKNSKD